MVVVPWCLQDGFVDWRGASLALSLGSMVPPWNSHGAFMESHHRSVRVDEGRNCRNLLAINVLRPRTLFAGLGGRRGTRYANCELITRTLAAAWQQLPILVGASKVPFGYFIAPVLSLCVPCVEGSAVRGGQPKKGSNLAFFSLFRYHFVRKYNHRLILTSSFKRYFFFRPECLRQILQCFGGYRDRGP